MIVEIKAALESLNDPLIYNQALIDCRNALNLSKETLEEHFLSWLWVGEDTPPYQGSDLTYALQLGEIEEELILQGLIYTEGLPTK